MFHPFSSTEENSLYVLSLYAFVHLIQPSNFLLLATSFISIAFQYSIMRIYQFIQSLIDESLDLFQHFAIIKYSSMLHMQPVSLFQKCRLILRRGFTRSNEGDCNFFFSLPPRKAAFTQPAAGNSLLWRSNGGLVGPAQIFYPQLF